MTPDATRALTALLPDIFSAEQLRPFLLGLGTEGRRVTDSIPSSNVAPATLFHEAVQALNRRGLLKTAEFWNHLRAEAGPAREPEVAALAQRFGIQLQASVTPASVSSQPAATTAPRNADKFVVLLVSASPDAEVRLRVDAEFRDIINKIDSTPARELIDFKQVNAARFEDLRSALLRHEPNVLHISSHGEADGSLLFEARDKSGSQAISKRRMIGLLTELNENLRLVVVNACYSQALARDIPPEIDLAIGMNTAVADDAAIEFSVSFYETLAYRKPVEKAFKVALASLEDDDAGVPELFPPADQDPGNKRQLKLLS